MACSGSKNLWRVPGNLGPEKKYGQNWDKKMWMCPRCVDAVPVFFKMSERGQATLEKALAATEKPELKIIEVEK